MVSFTRFGFEAAAASALGVAVAGRAHPSDTGVERRAILRFDHPYAAVAITGQPNSANRATRFAGLPLFSAWIETPAEADEAVEAT